MKAGVGLVIQVGCLDTGKLVLTVIFLEIHLTLFITLNKNETETSQSFKDKENQNHIMLELFKVFI